VGLNHKMKNRSVPFSSIIFALLLTGFVAVVSQTLLIRELLITFSGNELTIGIIIANWVFLTAVGSIIFAHLADRIRNRILVFILAQIVIAFYLPLSIYLTRNIKNIVGILPHETLGFFSTFYLSFGLLAVLCIFIGALFVLGCRIYAELLKNSEVNIVGRGYVIDALGHMLGGIIFTYILVTRYTSWEVSFIAGELLLFSAFWLSKRLNKKIYALSILLLFFLNSAVIYIGLPRKLHQKSLADQWKNLNLLHYENTIYNNIVTLKNAEQYTFCTNGVPMITVPIPDIIYSEEYTHLSLLHHPVPKKILLIGAGAGGILNELLKYSLLEKIDYVEPDPRLIEVIKMYPTELTVKELADRRVQLVHTDARLFLRSLQEKYDLILLNLPAPTSLSINRFYTLEFFEMTRDKLLPGSLTYLELTMRNLNLSIYETLKKNYSAVKIIPGESYNLYLCSAKENILQVDTKVLLQRLRNTKIQTKVLTENYLQYRLAPHWLDWFLESVGRNPPAGGEVRVNYDFRPTGLYYGISYWNAMFSPKMAKILSLLVRVNYGWLILAIGLIFFGFLIFTILNRKFSARIKTVFTVNTIITTGLMGMVYSIILLLSFQVAYGYLYYKLALLTAAFMVGLSIGGLTGTKFSTKYGRVDTNLKFLSAIEFMLVIFSVVLAMILRSKLITFEILFYILAVGNGFLVGIEFPLASKIFLLVKETVGKTAGTLYSADLFGAWLGGLLISIWFLPVYGVLNSCLLLLFLKLISFAFLRLSLRGF